MSEYIKIFNPGTIEYKRLAAAAALMTAQSPNGYIYYVSETYFDFGQNWVWTTVLYHDPDSDWGDVQALYPVQQERILTGDIVGGVEDYFAGKWCGDRPPEARVAERNDAAIAGLAKMY